MLAAINELLRSKSLMLRAGTVVDATLIAAPSSTKNADGERDPEMHQTKKGNNYYFGMKAHISADAESGLVHTPCCVERLRKRVRAVPTAPNELPFSRFGDSPRI